MKRILLTLAALGTALTMQAKVVLPGIFGDNMVLQQQSEAQFWGKVAPGKKVTIRPSWSAKPVTATAGRDGCWQAAVPTPEAGGPYTIELSDGETLKLRDVLIGEVWLCSGQSNMEMPVGGWGCVMNYKEEIANAKYDNIRFLQVAKQTGFAPAKNTNVNMGGWRTCSPSTVENFSSIAYFYAREMAKRLGVHVGVIDYTWGGTPAEAWSSLDGVASVQGFESEVAKLRKIRPDINNMEAHEWLALLEKSCKPFDASTFHESLPTMPVPCEWEKSALPDFDGIVWLQYCIDIPDDWGGKPIEMHLGMIDDEDITYFNGTKIAQGSGYNVKRIYTIPANLVKAGRAVISVRVSDFRGGGGIWGEKADVKAVQGDKVISLAGNWKYFIATDLKSLPPRPASMEGSSYPTVLYNAMLYPLHIMPVKGVLWYQGCANVGRDAQYSLLFKRLIKDWRALWKNEQMPFYFVQLAGYLKPQFIQPDSEWAALRQAQADALTLDGTAMAVAIDIGNPYDIHPKNKQEVARRLSLIALNRTYGRGEVVCEAPKPVSYSTLGNDALVKFDGEVKADGGAPMGFIALVGGEWIRPEARITDFNVVRLTAHGHIEQVKYNWADYPDGNLRGTTGLPVAPFSLPQRDR